MRNSPNESATLYKLNTKKIGNDGNMYIIKETSVGIKRWVKFNDLPKGKVYLTHDNGARPYKVIIDGLNVYVYDNKTDKLIIKYKVSKVYIGKNIKNSKINGNTIVIQINKNKCVYIGDAIYEFEIDDEIVKYFSPIDNSDVPYPVLVGTKNVYFMLNKEYVILDEFPNEMRLNDFSEAYGLYYVGIRTKVKNENVEVLPPLKNVAKKMKHLKIIKKRINY